MSAPKPKAQPKSLPKEQPDSRISSEQAGWAQWLASRSGIVSLLLVGVTLAVYWPVADFGFINFDDHDYVTENSHVQAGLTWHGAVWAFVTGYTGNWHPLTWLSHMLDVELFGRGAAGAHVMNLLFHVANAVLLFQLLKRLTRAFGRSAFVAALFALHPLHVESVAWVSERKDVLSTFFGLLALIFYARYALKRARVEERESKTPTSSALDSRPPTLDYVLALFCFALGLMSKSMLVTLPFLLLLLDFWPLQRFQLPCIGLGSQVSRFRRLLTEKIPFFMLSMASCIVTIAVQREAGAMSPVSGLPLLVRIQNALISYARYLGKNFFPVDLALPYPYPTSWPLEQVIGAAVLVAALCWAAVWTRRRWPFLFVGWFWFWGMMFPVIGLVQVGTQSMADRYTYVPLIGVFIILAWGAGEMTTRHPLLKPYFLIVGILALGACALRTSNQVRHWRDSRSLFGHAIVVTKDNDIAFSLLGHSFLDNGQVDEAIYNYRMALQIVFGNGYSPSNIFAKIAGSSQMSLASENDKRILFRADSKKLATFAVVLHNLGTILAHKGKVEEAMEYYRASLLIKPDNLFALSNLASELAAQKEYALAIQLYEEALSLSPDDAETHNCLGLALVAQGRTTEAIPHFEAALRADARMVDVHNSLGAALLGVGNPDDAIRHFRLLLQAKPDLAVAHENLAIALASKGQFDDAAIHFRKAIRLQPDNADSHYNLGNILASQGKFQEAIEEFQEALLLFPNHAQAHCNLGAALAEVGRRDESVAHLQEALRLKPDLEQAKRLLLNLGSP